MISLENISVLCVAKKSNYKNFVGLDLWDEKRDAYNFKRNEFVIAHPPCAQWSRMKGFSTRDRKEKDLAIHCMNRIHNAPGGGIFEHPAGSSFFKYVGITPTIEINQLWFGFPCRKATWLYFHKIEPLPVSFIPVMSTRGVNNMDKEDRAVMPFAFCAWLIDCIIKSNS